MEFYAEAPGEQFMSRPPGKQFYAEAPGKRFIADNDVNLILFAKQKILIWARCLDSLQCEDIFFFSFHFKIRILETKLNFSYQNVNCYWSAHTSIRNLVSGPLKKIRTLFKFFRFHTPMNRVVVNILIKPHTL